MMYSPFQKTWQLYICVYVFLVFENFWTLYLGRSECLTVEVSIIVWNVVVKQWEVLKFSEEDIRTSWTKSRVWNSWKQLKWLVMFRSKSKVPTYWNTKFTKTTKMEKTTCVWVFLRQKKWLKMYKRCMRYQSIKYLNTQILFFRVWFLLCFFWCVCVGWKMKKNLQ